MALMENTAKEEKSTVDTGAVTSPLPGILRVYVLEAAGLRTVEQMQVRVGGGVGVSLGVGVWG